MTITAKKKFFLLLVQFGDRRTEARFLKLNRRITKDSLVSVIEELLEKKSSSSDLENRNYGSRDAPR
jgi:hypothetical protein